MHEVVAFSGVFLGVLCRTLLPYVEKLRDALDRGVKIAWDNRYGYTASAALFLSFVTSALAFPSIQIPSSTPSLLYLLLIGFGYGWGLNDALNKFLIDWRETKNKIGK